MHDEAVDIGTIPRAIPRGRHNAMFWARNRLCHNGIHMDFEVCTDHFAVSV